MTINPESVKAYARELLEAEERGRREVNAELLAACKAVVRECDEVFIDPADMSPAWRAIEAQCREAINKAEASQ